MFSGGNISKPLEAVNEFSSGLWSDIDACLARARSSNATAERPVAVFDADHTLWDQDAGETFFQWQLDNCEFQNLPEDPWAHYRNWKKRDPHGAYAWLAQISAGTELAKVRAWAQDCYDSNRPWPVFRSIQDLFRKLQAAEFDIFIVTASVKWAVEPAALDLLGVPHENILGIETETPTDANGTRIVSDIVKSPITYRQGKADALLKASGGRKPILSAGNTLGDIALLDIARDFKLMIQSQSPLLSQNAGLLAEEKKLRDHGRPLGWRLHAFRS
ncbi:hypothetical protein BH10BDE1_BH10BDE1_31730 [soil metagenome]